MSSTQRRASMRIPPFFRRLFKFTSMDFETKQTKSTYHRPDPAFTYLLALFLLLTGLAWGLAYTSGASGPIRVALVFVLGHFLGTSLAVSTLMYFLVGRVLGKRRQGLFGPGPPGPGEEGLEFGYCFDVSIRAYLPIWVFLYILQFLLMPLIAQDYSFASNFFGNTLYLVALAYYFVITFLGYNALPFLSRTEVLLAPIPVLVIIWLISLFTFDCATNLAPVLWCGVGLRKPV
ncbi:uncharacterized protein LTR77_003249 [Saxophila tyrrhenica]|uniref:UNC-50 family protein n=1 Tax=Saxophila tyrrhenica TaxID=1690608 RepID=A0AAV9PHG7_9PEZI|nr:hypothetical protein LTR77_003249 [Saxophila tyrrhenica]